MRKLLQTPTFSKHKKKLHKNQIAELDTVIKAIHQDPYIGEQKKGDLASVFVYKCKITKQLFLIAYQFDDSEIILLSMGSHENFYKELKR
jgi:mRNA-degrading endonuclease YafQ of YafQ-DinJ toxin-antitoxin module